MLIKIIQHVYLVKYIHNLLKYICNHVFKSILNILCKFEQVT